MSEVPAIAWLATAARGCRYLVAVSGGADSVALLHLLVESGFRRLVVCHLDHRLRGRTSAADARFVRKLADSLELPCEIGKADVRARMAERGESMETAARHARHEFLAACARKHRCRRVLLAHHADDQAETILWNLLRGSHGLKGMRPEQRITAAGTELRLIRPLLEIRRQELVSWLQARGYRWREDASNALPVAVRNRLRNEVFPLLGEISGRDAVAALVRAAADSGEREAHERVLLEQARVLDPQGRLHLPALRRLPAILQRSAFRDYLADHGVTSVDRRLLDECLVLADPARGSTLNLPGGRRLRRRAARIWIE